MAENFASGIDIMYICVLGVGEYHCKSNMEVWEKHVCSMTIVVKFRSIDPCD